MVDTIVLAGGSSRRFTRNKLSEPYQGKPLIYYTIKPFYAVSNRIIIVTGEYVLPDVSKEFDMDQMVVVYNEDHLDGMFTSVLCGARETSNDAFIIPGDMPLVKPETLQILLDASGDIRVPVYQNQRGHPIYLSQTILAKLVKEPPTSNLKLFRDRFPVTYVPVEDPGVLIDIDQIEDFHTHLLERTKTDED